MLVGAGPGAGTGAGAGVGAGAGAGVGAGAGAGVGAGAGAGGGDAPVDGLSAPALAPPPQAAKYAVPTVADSALKKRRRESVLREFLSDFIATVSKVDQLPAMLGYDANDTSPWPRFRHESPASWRQLVTSALGV